jgi:hypothetical protein
VNNEDAVVKYAKLLRITKKMLKEVSDINIRERKRAGLKDGEHIISGNFKLNQIHFEMNSIVNSGASERLIKSIK